MRTIVIIILSVSILLINFSDQANGFKKKKVLKKIKDALPLMLALKPRKKILLLPIPFPMKGKGKGSEILSSLRNMRPFGNLMDSDSGWGSNQQTANYMTIPVPVQIQAPAPMPPPPPPQPIKYMMVPTPVQIQTPPPPPPPQQIMMVPMPMPEFTPHRPSPKPSAPIMQHYSSPIDHLNNQMMNQAMDTWMMMAAMDCFGMDNMGHSHGETPNIVSDKIIYREPSKQSYRSPAQIVREIPTKTNPLPPPPPPPVPEPVQTPITQTFYEPIQRPITQNDDSSFDHEPIKGEKVKEYSVPQQQPIQQQQQQQQQQQHQEQLHGGQTYFPTSDFGTGNRFVEPIKSSRAPIKGGY